MNQRASEPLKLVADIGGTNARFALLDDERRPVEPVTLRCDDFPDLASAVIAFLGDQPLSRLQSAAVAVATAVTGDQIKLTNNHWSFSIEQTRVALGLDSLQVVNDWTALALSVRHLPNSDVQQIGSGSPATDHAIALIGSRYRAWRIRPDPLRLALDCLAG